MLTQPLTRPLTRKIHRAQLTSIRYRDFDPLSLEPYLLFDAASSMLGNLENPTLDLDASDNGSLDVITATRAGIATFTAADGQIVTADPNTVRVDWSLGYPAMLIEPSATNLVPYSEDFENLAWYKSGLDLSYGELSPAGDNTATKLTATDSNPYLFIYVNTTAETHTFSFYCKGEGDSIGKTARVLFWYTSTATGPTESFEFTLTDQWQRHEFQTTPTGAGQVAYRIDIPANNSQAGDVAYLWGAQIELGSVATSYIPNNTGSSSTGVRNADNLVIDGTNFSDFYNGSEGTFYVEAVNKDPYSSHQYLASSYPKYFLYSNSSTNNVATYDSVNYLSRGPVVANQLTRMAMTYNSATSLTSLSLNGGTSVDQPYNGSFSTSNVLAIGSTGAGSSFLNGHIRRIIYWPTSSDSL